MALSTSYAKYIATDPRVCQAIWLKRVLVDLQQKQKIKKAIEIFCGNKATISMTKNPTFHSRTKYIRFRHPHIRNLVAKKKKKKKKEIFLKYMHFIFFLCLFSMAILVSNKWYTLFEGSRKGVESRLRGG